MDYFNIQNTSNMKSWSRNPLVRLDLSSGLSFKIIGDFQSQSYTKHAISALSLLVETQYVLPSYRKSWPWNPLMILFLTYHLSFDVICDFQGHTYTNHAISPLLLSVDIQYVLPSYNIMKSWSRNPLVILVLTYMTFHSR